MIDTLISVLLVSFASVYFIEFIDLIFYTLIEKSTVNRFLSAPLNFGGLWLFGYHEWYLLVLVPATTFISLLLYQFVNRPRVVVRSGSSTPRLF